MLYNICLSLSDLLHSFFVCCLFLVMLCSMQDLSSLTRNQTHALYSGSTVLTTGPPGKSLTSLCMKITRSIYVTENGIISFPFMAECNNPTPGHTSGENHNLKGCSLKHYVLLYTQALYTQGHRSNLNIDRGMDKADVVRTYNGILLSSRSFRWGMCCLLHSPSWQPYSSVYLSAIF